MLQLQHDVLRVSVNPKINITTTKMIWSWKEHQSVFHRFRSAIYILTKYVFFVILKCILFTSHRIAALLHDWWQKFVCCKHSVRFHYITSSVKSLKQKFRERGKCIVRSMHLYLYVHICTEVNCSTIILFIWNTHICSPLEFVNFLLTITATAAKESFKDVITWCIKYNFTDT